MMIKKQLHLVKQEVSNQARTIFRVERRKNQAKRQFIESIYKDQTTGCEREDVIIIITLTLARLRELWKSTGDSKAVWDVMADNTAKPMPEE